MILDRSVLRDVDEGLWRMLHHEGHYAQIDLQPRENPHCLLVFQRAQLKDLNAPLFCRHA